MITISPKPESRVDRGDGVLELTYRSCEEADIAADELGRWRCTVHQNIVEVTVHEDRGLRPRVWRGWWPR